MRMMWSSICRVNVQTEQKRQFQSAIISGIMEHRDDEANKNGEGIKV